MGNQLRRAKLIEEIACKQEELETIEKELDDLEKLPPYERIAIGLHDMLCKHNHTDGCGWHYEVKKGVHDWSANEHKRWIKKGVKLNDFIDDHNISEGNLFDLIHVATQY